jgi:coproporphyrinogen III oxidase-like Fe-S oxidoreductase
MVGLRTKWGVSISELKSYLDLDDEWLRELDELMTAGDLRNSNDSLVLTESGKLRADAIASTLFKLSN